MEKDEKKQEETKVEEIKQKPVKAEKVKVEKPIKINVNKKAEKAKIHLLKLSKNNKVNLNLYDKLAIEYTDSIDIEDMAYSVASVESTYLKYFQTILFDGYDYNITNNVKYNKKEARSEEYTKAAILFGDKKMLIYAYSFTLCGGYEKKAYTEVYYKNISAISIVNENVKRLAGKEEIFVTNNTLNINVGVNIVLPLQNVKSFDDKPVLKEMLKFIESRKA